ncbi:hypothetical protein Tco_0387487, partial [Tanacetum coccineum]
DEDEDEEDKEDEEEEEEEHLASADPTTVIPTDEPVFPPESTRGRGECLVRSMAPPTHASPPPMPSPLLPSSGCLTQIQTLRIASTQALIDAVTAALPLIDNF